jgi:hypothetical protein
MRFLLLSCLLCACGTSSNTPDASTSNDAASHDFTCSGTWVCNSDAGVMIGTLTNEDAGCVIESFTPPALLDLDGTLHSGSDVAHVTGSGDSVRFDLGGVGYACRGASPSTQQCSPSCGQ